MSPCVGHFLYKILRFESQVFTELISFLSFFFFLLLETKIITKIITNTSSFNYLSYFLFSQWAERKNQINKRKERKKTKLKEVDFISVTL